MAKLGKLLSRVDAAQARLATIPRILKRFRQSLLASAFAQNEGRTKLEDIFSVQTGGTPDRKNPLFYIGGDVPWVKTSEVQNCEIFESEEFITDEGLRNSNAKLFPAGTLLVAMYGEGKTRGQIARLRLEASTNQACAALVNPNLSQVSNRYVYFFLLSQYHKLRAQAVGGNQPNLNLATIKSWMMPFPPEAQQETIVRRVERLFKTADALEARYHRAKADVDRLMQSILARAFRGELVPQDPNDETASALLDHIRRSRQNSSEAAGKTGRVRKVTDGMRRTSKAVHEN